MLGTTAPRRVAQEKVHIESAGGRFEGIQLLALNASGTAWMAAVEGPVGSVYEGGVFFLSLLLPPNYPLKPPHIRFLTRILHPNVSPHGDIGVDILGSHWVFTLSIDKILLSIRSLFHDPNPLLPMHPPIGRLAVQRPHAFRLLAQWATQHYAMSHMGLFWKRQRCNQCIFNLGDEPLQAQWIENLPE